MEHLGTYRTVWISDVHLGTPDCKAEKLLAFLSRVRCEHLYLVGDIVDVWSLRRKWYWPRSHNHVVRKIIKRDLDGTRVTFVPGNHDEIFRDFDGMSFGGVTIRTEAIHETADGRRILVVHGDEFDAVVRNAKLITAVGDWLYYVLLWVNRVFNAVRRRFGLPYWSLAAYVKSKVKRAVQFVGNFEAAVVRSAAERQVQAVLCGHIHRPEIRTLEGLTYLNTGDWVENCSAIVEHHDGRLELLDLGHLEWEPAGERREQAPRRGARRRRSSAPTT
jgi:UDP-2,3-diacylglucosamine pyrophosphatase LpxH